MGGTLHNVKVSSMFRFCHLRPKVLFTMLCPKCFQENDIATDKTLFYSASITFSVRCGKKVIYDTIKNIDRHTIDRTRKIFTQKTEKNNT